MKILKAKDFNGEWLCYRRFLCNLPTEMVIPDRYDNINIPPIKRVYYYILPRKDFPPKEVNMLNSRSWYDQVAIEVYSDHGDDGHTDYIFMNKFILLYYDEIENFTFIKYEELMSKMYTMEEESRIHET